MTISAELVPFGGLLDSLLDRLAALEKVAVLTAAPSTFTSGEKQESGRNEDDTTLIKSLQTEVADLISKLDNSEKQVQRLERQLASAGIKVAEDIPYDVAKEKIMTIAERMTEIGGSNVVDDDEEKQKTLREEYFTLELEMEKYNNALVTSEEYIAEGLSKEQQWEKDVSENNRQALMAIRRHMPVNIKNYSESQLTDTRTPSGRYLPKDIARKFKRCNVLQLLRVEPNLIARSHPASLENYRVSGMTLTERRAVYSHLTESVIDDGSDMTVSQLWAKNQKDPNMERKFVWYIMMRDNLKSTLRTYEAHVKECGQLDEHECDLIGRSCPVRADGMINYYEINYGYPEGDEYQQQEEAVSVSLSVNPERMADPSQLSGNRVKDELRNRKRLAYEQWKETHEAEHKLYTEKIAARGLKMEDLEAYIEECKADEVEYEEEHKRLKSSLKGLTRGSRDRLPLMKKVNVAMTQYKEAKRRGAVAVEELERLKATPTKEFVCSMTKPEWNEEDDKDQNQDAQPLSSSNGMNGGVMRHSKDSEESSSRGHITSTSVLTGRGGPSRGGLLSAIQGRGSGRGGSFRGSGPKPFLESLKDAKEEEWRDEGTITDKNSASPEPEQKSPSQYTRKAANDSADSQYTRKPSSDSAIAASMLPRNQPELNMRSRGGTGVNKTSLVSCPPEMGHKLRPTKSKEQAAAEEKQRLKVEREKKEAAEGAVRMRKEKAALEERLRKQQEEEELRAAEIERSQVKARERNERLRKEREARQKEEAEGKARAEAEDRQRQEARAKNKEAEREARRHEEARQREEAEAKERERQEARVKKREEEELSRILAKEAEKQRFGEEEARKKEEKEQATQNAVAELEQRVASSTEEEAQHEATLKQLKKDLKEIPRGAKERVAKMKEINKAQSARGEAKKAAKAAQEELDICLRSR